MLKLNLFNGKQACVLLSLTIILFTPANAQNPKVKTIEIRDCLSVAQSAQMGGFIGARLNASYENRIITQDIDRLVDVFRKRTETHCWQSEFWGKWFTSAVLAYRYRPEPKLKAILDHAITSLIATQTPDGYIGNYTESERLEQWDIWGRKYCMLGLLAYYDLTQDKKSLDAACKLTDNLIKELSDKKVLIVRKGNHRGMAASSVLEPVVLLFSRTNDQRYLDFAEEIVSQWESPDGPQLISKAEVNVSQRFPKAENWFGWEQGQKAYEMMSCYEGLLELYRITGKEKYKSSAVQTWNNIKNTEINIAGSGSSVECWFKGASLQTLPVSHYQETCVTVTWIKLSLQLLRLTGEPLYADAIEQAYYNALLGSMNTDGSDWSKYTPLNGKRLKGDEQCGMGINCCVASGPRGLFALPFYSVMSNQHGICINFFVEGTYQLQTPQGRSLKFIQETNYPVSGNIRFKLIIPQTEEMVLSFRIPDWSRNSLIRVNGDTIKGFFAGNYAAIKRKWNSGDIIDLDLDMSGRVIYSGELPGNIAIIRGPIVLARDSRLGGEHVDETITPVTDKQGYFPLEPVKINENQIWMQYKGDFMLESSKARVNNRQSLLLCDYTSAGKTYSDSSWFRVWFPQKVNPSK